LKTDSHLEFVGLIINWSNLIFIEVENPKI